MLRTLYALFVTLLISVSSAAFAVTVQDSKGEFTLSYHPQRIVVLEFSFADALASVDVSPIGIADDKKSSRVLKEVRDIIGKWTSVGTRSQPSLEVISSLKPDLIIADINRHEAIYDDLKKIAPTVILQSRGETYEDNLKSAAIIGKVVGKEEQMQERLAQHRNTMKAFAEKLPDDIEVQFSIARKDNFYIHTADAYAGGVIHALGLKNPEITKGDKASRKVGLEQLLAINPEYLIVGPYSTPNIIDVWQTEPLWSALKIAQNNNLHEVNANVWSRCRGIMAAERIAEDLVGIFEK